MTDGSSKMDLFLKRLEKSLRKTHILHTATSASVYTMTHSCAACEPGNKKNISFILDTVYKHQVSFQTVKTC